MSKNYKKYCVWDKQLNQYAFSGKIFMSQNEAIEQLLSYFSSDHDKRELREIKKYLKKDGEFAGLELQVFAGFQTNEVTLEAFKVIMYDLECLELKDTEDNKYHYELLKQNLRDVFGLN